MYSYQHIPWRKQRSKQSSHVLSHLKVNFTIKVLPTKFSVQLIIEVELTLSSCNDQWNFPCLEFLFVKFWPVLIYKEKYLNSHVYTKIQQGAISCKNLWSAIVKHLQHFKQLVIVITWRPFFYISYNVFLHI